MIFITIILLNYLHYLKDSQDNLFVWKAIPDYQSLPLPTFQLLPHLQVLEYLGRPKHYQK